MTDMNNQEELLLDETIDDLADLPEQKPFPNGAHLVSIKISRIDKKPGAYSVNMTYKQPIELANPAQDPPAEGDKSAVFIHTKKKDGTKNELGQGQLKIILAPIGAMLGSNVIQEIIDATKHGLDVMVVTKIRKGNDQYDDSQEIKNLELPA